MLYFLMADAGQRRNAAESPDDRPQGTRLMLALALFYYAYKISKDLRVIFMHVMDSDSSLHSRLLAICRIAWETGFQTKPTAVGYMLEILLNSGYVVALYLLNVVRSFTCTTSQRNGSFVVQLTFVCPVRVV